MRSMTTREREYQRNDDQEFNTELSLNYKTWSINIRKQQH